MRYYISLFVLYIFLIFGEVFINLVSPFRFKIPVIFPLLIVIAVSAPFRSRFSYRTALPLIFIGSFALETISAVSAGLVFIISFCISLVALSLIKHFMYEEDFKALIVTLFFSSLFERFLIITLSTLSFLKSSSFIIFLKDQTIYMVMPSLSAIVVGLIWFAIINWKSMKPYLSWLNFQPE